MKGGLICWIYNGVMVSDVLLHASCNYTGFVINGCLREHAIGFAPIHTFTTLEVEYIRGNHNAKRCLTSLIKIQTCFHISSFQQLVLQVYLNQPVRAHLPLPLAEGQCPGLTLPPPPKAKQISFALKIRRKKN